MAHSNSSLNSFASCMAKFKYRYVDKLEPTGPISPHLTFGIMAHEVLYKAGILRDDCRDCCVEPGEYNSIIPSEIMYGDLKQTFSISNWQKYFTPVIKQIAEYEKSLVSEFEQYEIHREEKLQLTVEELESAGLVYTGVLKQSLVGIIDLLILDTINKQAVIVDYKFSANRKNQDDFDLNSQLPIYALLVNKIYGIPVRNIRCGYIDIPKQEFGKPTILSNGTLSRAKSQNVSQDFYEQAVTAIHGDDPYYNCGVGGYYYDAWCCMALNKCAYLSIQYLDIDVYNNVVRDILDAAQMIDKLEDLNLPYLKKYDSYTCKSCEYLDVCKPWLGVGGNL